MCSQAPRSSPATPGPGGCPPLRVVLTPGSGSGNFFMSVSLTSTIDGQAAYGDVAAQLVSTVRPDLYSINPDVGIGVLEPTPVTQVVSEPTELSGSSTKDVFLLNQSEPRTPSPSRPRYPSRPATPATSRWPRPRPALVSDPGASADQTSALENGTYTVTLSSGDGIVIAVTDPRGQPPLRRRRA